MENDLIVEPFSHNTLDMEDRHLEPVLLVVATVAREKLVADDLVPKNVAGLGLDVAG